MIVSSDKNKTTMKYRKMVKQERFYNEKAFKRKRIINTAQIEEKLKCQERLNLMDKKKKKS
jgi:hypothetical protein